MLRSKCLISVKNIVKFYTDVRHHYNSIMTPYYCILECYFGHSFYHTLHHYLIVPDMPVCSLFRL